MIHLRSAGGVGRGLRQATRPGLEDEEAELYPSREAGDRASAEAEGKQGKEVSVADTLRTGRLVG